MKKTKLKRELIKIPLKELKEYERNNKKHGENVLEIQDSIDRNGYIEPIIIDENNVILAGHGRLQALNLGDVEEEEVIRVTGLTDKQKADFRISSNLLTTLSEWDRKNIELEVKEFELEAVGKHFDIELNPIELDEEREDSIPDMEDKPIIVEEGDIFQLGEHRLMCGDSTNIEDVEKLMDGEKGDCVVTDPPYNTGMKENKKDEKAWLSHMFNDSFTDEERDIFLSDFFANYFSITKGDCAFYVFIDWRRVNDIREKMEEIMDVKNVIVRDKKVHGLGSDYKSTYELCVVGKKGKPDIQNRYGLDYQDIRRLQREMGRNKMHATVKPIELLQKPILHASKKDDIVIDLFGGAGSTLVACEKEGRRCNMMELDPKYIQVILKRYHDYTKGQKEIKCLNRDLDLTPILNA